MFDADEREVCGTSLRCMSLSINLLLELSTNTAANTYIFNRHIHTYNGFSYIVFIITVSIINFYVVSLNIVNIFL